MKTAVSLLWLSSCISTCFETYKYCPQISFKALESLCYQEANLQRPCWSICSRYQNHSETIGSVYSSLISDMMSMMSVMSVMIVMTSVMIVMIMKIFVWFHHTAKTSAGIGTSPHRYYLFRSSLWYHGSQISCIMRGTVCQDSRLRNQSWIPAVCHWPSEDLMAHSSYHLWWQTWSPWRICWYTDTDVYLSSGSYRTTSADEETKTTTQERSHESRTQTQNTRQASFYTTPRNIREKVAYVSQPKDLPRLMKNILHT